MSITDLERLKNLYDGSDYEKNTVNWEDSVSKYRSKAFFKALNNAGLNKDIKSVLDVGCGSGGVLVDLNRKYGEKLGDNDVRYFGIDISAKAIGVANKLYSDSVYNNILFSVKSITDDLELDAFTVVSLIHVLEHCPDMYEMLSHCSEKGKYVYINVPLEVNLFYVLRRKVIRNQYEKYGHVHFFDENFFLSWLKNNQFVVLSKVYSEDFKIDKKGLWYSLVKKLREVVGAGVSHSFAAWLLGGYSLGVLVKKADE